MFYQVLNAVISGGVQWRLKKKMLNGEIVFHLKRIGTEKHMRTSGFYRYEHLQKGGISKHS